MIGKMLGNRYEILEKIGEGGMSIVYKAQCQILNRIVAIKVLKEEYANDDEFLQKFKNEALSVAKLNHANIINVFDVGQDEDISYIVMEYVDGKNLKEILKEEKKFSAEKVMDIAKQIAMALEEAHNKKIVHRDIKTQNIMLTSKGVVKVGDFGIAKAVSSSTITASGAIMGSVHYFSPEQARGGFVDERSDLYSLGIIMYEMATGRLPFDGDSPVNIALKHIQEKLEFRDSDEISSGIKDMIKKLTQKSPDKRYANARLLIEDIDYLQMGKKSVEVDEDDLFATKKVPIPPHNMQNRYRKEERYEDDEEDEVEDIVPTPRRKKKGSNHLSTFFAVLLGVIVVGMLGIFYLMMGRPFGGGQNNAIPIPHIVGMTEEQARTELEKIGLQLNVKGTEVNNKYEIGQITDTDPNEGIKVSKGTIVNVTLAKSEEETITIDNFEGKKLQDLEKEYGEKLKFKAEYVPSNEPTDTVLRQQPQEGAKVALGGEVVLFLSKNSEDIPIPVPNVVGKSFDEAKGILSSFKVSDSYKEDTSKPEGVVLSQNPSEGSQARPKSTVSVVINKYEAPKATKKRLAVTLPQGSETVAVRISEDSTGKVIYEKTVNYSEVDGVLSIDVEGKEGEEKTFSIDVDGSYYDSTTIHF